MLELDGGCTPPKWKRPEDVMKAHRMKMKKRALQSRFVRSMDPSSSSPVTVAGPAAQISPAKNPFRWVRLLKRYLCGFYFLLFHLNVAVYADVKRPSRTKRRTHARRWNEPGSSMTMTTRARPPCRNYYETASLYRTCLSATRWTRASSRSWTSCASPFQWPSSTR